MRWFLVYYLIGGRRYDFACVPEVYRRGAYLTVARALAEAASECLRGQGDYSGRTGWLWDADDMGPADWARPAPKFPEEKSLGAY